MGKKQNIQEVEEIEITQEELQVEKTALIDKQGFINKHLAVLNRVPRTQNTDKIASLLMKK